LTSIIWIMNDVSHVRQLEEERDLQLKAVLESALSGMLMAGHDGTISLVNAKIEEMFGYARGELIGQPVACMLPTRDRARFEGGRIDLLSAPVFRPPGAGGKLHGLRKDGSEFDIEIGLTPIHLSTGTSVLATIVDITDRKHVVRHVRDTSQVEVTDGAVGIAHELNNSLTAVLGFSELALPLIATDSKAHRHISQVIAAGRRARELAQTIRRALDHSPSYSEPISVPSNPGPEPSTLQIEVSDAVGPRR
jgi:PAS domain S-box-containing protein